MQKSLKTFAYTLTIIVFEMVGIANSTEAEEIAWRMINDKIEDWHDLAAFGEPVFESSKTQQPEGTLVYVLKGYVDVEFKTGWLSSARERSRSGRVLFTVKLDAQNGKVLSVKHRAEQE